MTSLVAISLEDLPILRDLYRAEWPRHLTTYQMLNHFILWLKQSPQIEGLSIWALTSWRENGSIIVQVHHDIFLATLDASHESFMELSELFTWRPGLLVHTIPEVLLSSVSSAIDRAKIPKQIAPDPCNVYTLPKEKALQLQSVDLPSGVSIRRILFEDVSAANDFWDFKWEGSLPGLETSATFNACFGAYAMNQLIGCVFIIPSGAVGVLHVVPEFRGKKIAQGLAVEMCKHIAGSLNLDPFVFIIPSNYPSIQLFKKLGFEDQNDFRYWIYT